MKLKSGIIKLIDEKLIKTKKDNYKRQVLKSS